ncbi:delta subunit of the central stalk of mitochondrial F1F0 ATP synthase, atp16 [Dissophora globulifera]|uniref:ATP synthase subunit delta, mitochondrial n=1 Tax=Dissophora globulifera TaxID=979702 RepID=A0A9P6RTS5_9FUNG|nr:delta subunit of the central stalk of mitochondrial F1F0 ATP synthase, atp16 [Dissophora globulifera]
MGILADHVPSIEQLRAGVVEVIDGATTKKFFVSGGFATMNSDSSLNINAVEAFPVEEFSAEAVRHNLAEAHRLANSGATEEEKTAGRIEVEVLEALQAALNAK